MTNPLWESFSWLTPDMKINDAPGDKVIIRGPALFSIEKYGLKGLSGNLRKYVQEEIIRSARTLKGVPIDVNHEISAWEERVRQNLPVGPKPVEKGNVIFGEEENGIIEYTAQVNHKEYREKVRDTDKVRKGLMKESDYLAKWGKDPLQGVSVDADFLRMRCTQTGCKKEFFDSKDYRDHMWNEHKIKDISIEPRGIVFKRLSLVEPPDKPGVSGANFEVVESLHGASQLLESVTKWYEQMEKERMTETEKLAKAAVSVQPEKTIVAGAIGISGRQSAYLSTFANPTKLNVLGTDKIKEVKHLTDKEVEEYASKLSALMPQILKTVQEAEYPWDQCVSDRQADGYDEDSAKRICAAIKNRTISHTAEKPLKEWGPGCKFSRNRRARETLKPTERDFDFKEMSQHHGPRYAAEKFEQMKEDYDYKTRMNEKVAAMETDMDEIESNMESETKKAVEFLRTDIKEHLDQHPKDDLGWKDEIKAVKESIPKDDLAWKEEIAKLTEIITAQKENSDKIVNALNEEYKKFKATSEEQIQKLTQEKATLENKVTETTRKLEETVTNVDNLKDKQKGTFKGKPVQEKSGGTSYTDPLTGR